MQKRGENNIEDILLKAGLISDEKLECIKGVAEETGENIEKVLLEQGITNYKEILRLKADRMGIGFVDLENASVDKDCIKFVGAETAKKHMVFPFGKKDEYLLLAMENPDDVFLNKELKEHTGMDIKPFLADSRLIKRAVSYFYPNEYSATTNMDRDSNRDINSDSKVGVEKLVQKIVNEGLLVENITNISIEPEKRSIVVTLNIKY